VTILAVTNVLNVANIVGTNHLYTPTKANCRITGSQGHNPSFIDKPFKKNCISYF